MEIIDAVPGRAAHRLYCHFVWPTLGRIPLVSRDTVAVVERHTITLCRRLDAEPICIRAFSDRVHLLLRIKPGHTPAALVARLKTGTESALQADGHTVRWGRGYAAASVSGSEVRSVMRRIHRLADAPLAAASSGRKPHRRRPSRKALVLHLRDVDAPRSTR